MSIVDPIHSVELGGLALMVEGKPAGSEDGYQLSVLGEDTTYGNPQPVTTTLYSMLRNGSVVSRDRDENRQPVLLVQVETELNDGNALALGEAAVMAVCRRPVELIWTPPQAGAEPVVFDVVDSNVDHAFDMTDEKRLRRTFRIVLSALPHARRDTETLVEAITVPVSPTTVSVDTADALTGWGGDATVSQTGGYVESTGYTKSGAGRKLRRTSITVDFTATPYLVVEWQGFPVVGTALVTLQMTNAVKASEQVLGDGWTRTQFRPTLTSLSVLEFIAQYDTGAGTFHQDATLRIRDLKRTDAPPLAGSGRQSFRSFDVGGTVTTQGSIDVAGTAALGDVAIYTFPLGGGYQPHLSQYQSAPVSRTTDTATLSGARNLVTAGAEWLVPAGNMPAGEYAVVARLRDSVAGTKAFSWSTRSRMGGVDVGPDVVTNMTFNFAVASQWYTVLLGVVDLPVTPISAAGQMRLALGTAVGTLEVDEILIFNTAGSLTMLTGVTKNRVAVRAPSLDESHGSIWVGNAADESDWYGASSLCVSRQHHDLEPGSNNLYAYTTGQINPTVTARHFDRFAHHPTLA